MKHHRASCYPLTSSGQQEGSGIILFMDLDTVTSQSVFKDSWMVFPESFSEGVLRDLSDSWTLDFPDFHRMVFLRIGFELVSELVFLVWILNSGTKSNCEFFNIIEQNCLTITNKYC